MGDFVKIKQIENLANELAQIPKAVEAANSAILRYSTSKKLLQDWVIPTQLVKLLKS